MRSAGRNNKSLDFRLPSCYEMTPETEAAGAAVAAILGCFWPWCDVSVLCYVSVI